MKITLNSKELNNRLQFLGGIIGANNTLPILDNFLFEIDNEQLKITASDLETTISTTIDVIFKGNLSVCVPAKLLIEILKTFAEQPLVFEITENNTMQIISNTGEYAIACLDSDEYPRSVEIKNSTSTSITANILSNAISKTLLAVGNDDLRPVMSGVLFDFHIDKLIFVATDAHKLIKYVRTDAGANEAVQFIVPKKPLSVLKNILSTSEQPTDIYYNTTNVRFVFFEYDLSIRLIDGKYPSYDAVIPKENPNKLIIDRLQFLQSVKRVNTFSNKTTHQIKLKLAGTELNISAEDVDYSNKADERLTCSYEGEDLEIGFNSKYLIEMLGNLDSKDVQLEMSTPTRAGILTQIDGLEAGETIVNLVMPVLISQK